jgi:Uma2 family endonuclease
MGAMGTPRGQQLVLSGISWRTYERLLRVFADRRLLISYDRGALEIMELSAKHERLKHLLGTLIGTLAVELNQDIAGFGSTTLKRRDKRRGLEPDEIYFVQNELRVRGRCEFHLRCDPPPDLVLEIDVPPSLVNRLGIFAALGVPEVWRWDGTNLQVCVFGSDSRYVIAERSRAFPVLRPAELVRFLGREVTLGEIGMLRAFRDWVRAQVANGWPNPPATPSPRADPAN